MSGLTTLAGSSGSACLLVDLPQASNLGTATLGLKQLRGLLAGLQLPEGQLQPAATAPAQAAEGVLPPAAVAALSADPDLQAYSGEGLILVMPGQADPAAVAGAAEALLKIWQTVDPDTNRLLITGSHGGLVIGRLAEGLIAAMVAATPGEIAAHNVHIKKLLSAVAPEAGP